MAFFDFWTESIAIDLGTANTLIIHNDKVVVDSPSIVAIDKRTDKIIAVGKEASLMQGKTHENIKTVRPLKDGVIADFNASEQMISLLINTKEDLSEGTTAKFFDDLETTLQDLLILVQHIVFLFAKIGVGASDKLVSSV